MFTGNKETINESTLQRINNVITEDQNRELEQMPTEEELSKVIMQMNPNSAPGPDGIGGKFFSGLF